MPPAITAPSTLLRAFGRGVALRLLVALFGLNSTDNLRVRIGIEVVLIGTGTLSFESGGEVGCFVGRLNC